VSYLAADQFFPEWNVWTQFLEESTTGFKLDALAGSHPIEVIKNLSFLVCNAMTVSVGIYRDINYILSVFEGLIHGCEG
jgi:hypothetical protein